jgi:hypothetical protein
MTGMGRDRANSVHAICASTSGRARSDNNY